MRSWWAQLTSDVLSGNTGMGIRPVTTEISCWLIYKAFLVDLAKRDGWRQLPAYWSPLNNNACRSHAFIDQYQANLHIYSGAVCTRNCVASMLFSTSNIHKLELNGDFLLLQTSYSKALRSKAKLSISGEPDRQSTDVISTSERQSASADVITSVGVCRH